MPPRRAPRTPPSGLAEQSEPADDDDALVYCCKRCGVTVALSIAAHRVACWRCRLRMQSLRGAARAVSA